MKSVARPRGCPKKLRLESGNPEVAEVESVIVYPEILVDAVASRWRAV
jgi:hypothetical protein